VADFAAAGAAETAGFTDGERREVVVEDEALGLGAAGEAVHFLGFLRGPEGGDGDVLGVAALEHGGAVGAGEDADLAWRGRRDLASRPSERLPWRGRWLAVGFVLEVFEDDVEVDIGELVGAEFGDEGGLGFLLEGFDVGGADVFLEAEDGGGKALGGDDALDDGAGLGGGADEREDGLGFAGEGDEFLDGGDDGLDGLVAELERLDELSSEIWSAEPSIISMSSSCRRR
jgi:hypothetical protein